MENMYGIDREEILNRIDPGTGLTLDQLIDACISNPIEAKNLKQYIRLYGDAAESEKYSERFQKEFGHLTTIRKENEE